MSVFLIRATERFENMPISELRITDFRNLAAAELSPCAQGLNIISGDNGSGKTSLLEAIHYLGSGKSFRCSTPHLLIKQQSEKFSIFSQLVSGNQHLLPIGIERHIEGRVALRIAEKDAQSVAELAQILPVRLINSQSHQIFESGPTYRRKYLDWGLFYHFEQFLPIWRQFERVLKQRNVVLKQKRPKTELEPWTNELVTLAVQVDAMRKQYISLLEPILAELAQELLSLPQVSISYDNGWNNASDYDDLLRQSANEEYRLGTTQYGPHRADIDIISNGVSIRHFLSRGQQKLLICAMILAQGILFNKLICKGLVYLVDDLPSELDLHSQQKLLSLLIRQQAQIYITAIEAETIYQAINGLNDVTVRVFHVEHGKVRQID